MGKRRHRWLAGAMAGFVALAAALSFAPKPIPAVPPPVRLEGALDTTNPTQNELVVVPAPSIDLGGEGSATTTTTVAPAGPPPALDDTPSQGSGGDDSEADDSEADDAGDDDSGADDSGDGSADSIDDSADSPDD
jgi:hypothetical protein